MSIVFYDDDDKARCDRYGCGGELQELKDGSMICLACNYVYQPDSVKKHKMKLEPLESRYERERDGASLVSMTMVSTQKAKYPG
jgi:hypothetical protein